MARHRQTCDRVIFRRWKPEYSYGHADVIALMPDSKNGRYIASYMHTGQHGDADYAHVIRQTTRVSRTDPEVKRLETEMRQIGYQPCASRKRR